MPANADVFDILRLVGDQIDVHGSMVRIRLDTVIKVCELMEFDKQKTLEIIEKIKIAESILYPVKTNG